MTQAELLEILNTMNLNLKSTDKDKYCRWDAESDKYLAELKCRRTHYEDQIIEYDKFMEVKKEADKQGKEFLYCVSSPEGVYIFNINKLCEEDYNFKWEDRGLPATTDFTNTNHKTKRVGYIDCSCASL